jgi:predicted  nucleic acid-binding Zn-ribbon protein
MLQKRIALIPRSWLIGGGVLLLLVLALTGVSIVAFRSIAATRATVSRLEARLEAADAEAERLQAELKTVSAGREQLEALLGARITTDVGRLQQEISRQNAQLDRLQLEILLLKASGKALKARIHLAERDPGLAKRDLRDCEVAIEAAMLLASDDTRTSLQEMKTGIVELRDSIEAQTFPLTTLEILIERINALIGR